MKRILMLGGADIQVSAIKLAKSLGHYVITCDYLPDNPGHTFSDAYHNVSTTDLPAVLALAKELQPDAVVAYASDPAALTAAYVCEQLGLPTNSYEVVELYSRKDLFRAFLEKHHFEVPFYKAVTSYAEAQAAAEMVTSRFVIKPVDSSGSKGVFIINKGEDFSEKFNQALSFSRNKLIILEEFIEKKGFQIGGDGFVVNGQLMFRQFGDIHFSKTNPVLPCSVSIPSTHEERVIAKVHAEVQRCITASGLKMGALNFDIMVDVQDRVFILEIGARNGGNMIPELVQYRTGVDMREYTIRCALGEDCSNLKQVEGNGYFSHYVIHSAKHGILKEVWRSPELVERLLFFNLNVKEGDSIRRFNSSADRHGIMLLKYKDQQDALHMIERMDQHLKLLVHE